MKGERFVSYDPTRTANNPILLSEIRLKENLPNGCFNLIKPEA